MPPKKRTSDVQTARGRLKGALNNMSGVGSDEDAENYLEELNDMPVSQGRGRPPKRFKDEKSITQQLKQLPTITTSIKLQSHDQHKNPAQSTYIMKLFDRSVDLAKYNESTSLYPICRAWMLNQPRSEKIVNFRNKRTPSPEQRKQLKNIADDIRTGKITAIQEMPEIDMNALHIKRIPSPLPFQMNQSKDNINLNYDLNSPILSKIDIMNDLKKRWTDVRKNWQLKSRDYQECKYGKSMRLLEAIYKS